MFYILVVDGKAHEVIPKFDPNLPDVPIEERFPASFIAQLVKSRKAIPQGWLFDAETGKFSEPPEPEPIEETHSFEAQMNFASPLGAEGDLGPKLLHDELMKIKKELGELREQIKTLQEVEK